MVNPLSIPTTPSTNPLSIPGGPVSTPTPPVATSAPIKAAPKPFASTPLGIATNTILGIPHAALGLAQDAGLAPGGKTPFAETPVGLATNTITDIPRSATHVGAEIGRGLGRDTLGLGRTMQNTIAPGSAPESEMPSPYLKELLGDQPIETIPTQFNNTKAAIENSDIAKKIGLSQFSAPLAFGAVLGNNILDFAPIGGEDTAIKNLVKETDPQIIQAALEKIGVHPQIAEKFAPHFAEASNAKEVKTLLKTVKGTQMLKHTAEAREALQSEPDLTYEPTAEESMQQMAHTEAHTPVESGIDENALNEYNKLTPTAPDESVGNIPTHLEPLAEHARESGSPEAFRQSMSDLQDKYIKGEPLTKKESDLLASLKAAQHDRIGTASEFYDRAVKVEEPKIAPELQPLAEEAKKYKTADEFINTPHEIPTSSFSTVNEPGKIFRNDFNEPRTPYDKGAIESQSIGKNTIEIGKGRDGKLIVSDGNHALQAAIDRGDQSVPIKFSPSDFTKKELTDLHAQATKGIAESVSPATEKAPGNIGKLDPTIEEQFARRSEGRTPAQELNTFTSGKGGKSWQSLIKSFSRTMTGREKINWLDYIGTPEFVLERIGLGKAAELLQEAKDTYRTTLKKEIDTISKWRDRVKGTPDSARRIFNYLDGHAKDVRHEMTDTEYQVAQEIKGYLKNWAKRLNLPEDSQISNYITHIFDKNATDLPEASAFDDPDLAVIMQNTPAKSVYNPFKEKRVNKNGYKEDVWAALDAYVKRGSRDESFTPVLEEISHMAHSLNPEAYQYITRLTARINMRPTEIDTLVDNWIKEKVGGKFTDRPVAYLTNKFRNVFYRGLLGLNVGSALRNLSQGANTYAKLGERFTATGYFQIFTKMITHNLSELYDHGILDEALIQDRKIGVYKSILQKIDPILFSLFDTAEKINRGAAFYGAQAKALNKGLSPEEAVTYAKRIVRETQFAFSAVDSPVFLSSDIIKTAAQLQNYNVKQIEFLMRMAKDKEFGGLLRWSLSSLAFVFTIGRMFGMTPGQLMPTVSIGNSPIFSLTGNLAKGIAGPTQQDRTTGMNSFAASASNVIPASAQIRKTYAGLKAYGAGKDVTAAGNTRYKIPHDTQHLIQAALFGKSALPEAQQYYKKLNNPKSKKSANNPLSV